MEKVFFSIQAKLFKTKENNIVQTVLLYLDESWNKLDALCVIMYVASITLESYNTKTTLNAARFDIILQMCDGLSISLLSKIERFSLLMSFYGLFVY